MQSMNLQLSNIPGIHAALCTLAALRLPFAKALALSKLCGRFLEMQQVYLQQLNALANEHGTEFLPNGTFPLPENTEHRQALCDALNKLVAEKVDVELEQVEISAADIGEQTIGAADILALSGIVLFS